MNFFTIQANSNRKIIYSIIFLIHLRYNQINLRIMANLNRIKIVLVEQQKTGKWLAEQMGKSACTVSKWCSNSSQPDLATLDKIATFLNVDRRELIAPSK